MWCCLLMRQHLPWFRNGLLWRQAGCPRGDITVWFVLQTRSHRSMLLCPGTDGTEISREFELGKVFTTAKWKWRISVDLASRSTSTGRVRGLRELGVGLNFRVLNSSGNVGDWDDERIVSSGLWALFFLYIFFIYSFVPSPPPKLRSRQVWRTQRSWDLFSMTKRSDDDLEWVYGRVKMKG